MNFDYLEEQKMLVQSLERTLAKDFDFETYRSLLESKTSHDPKLWGTLTELGIMAMPLPEAAGGFDGNHTDVALISAELGRRLVPEPFVSNVVLAAYIIGETMGDAGLAHLEAIAGGTQKFAAGFYEPGDRYNPLSTNTSAQKTPDGWSLNGHKAVVLGGDTADYYIVSADADGPSLFLVPKDTDGVSVRAYQLLDGRGAADIVLTDVKLPTDALMGDQAKSEDIIIAAVDRGAAALVSDSIGAIEEIIAMTKEYLRTRTQFGRPIGSFQVLAHRMVDVMVEYEQAKSIAMEASVEATNPDATVRMRVISAAKAKVGNVCRSIGQESVQMHGGIGMTDEYALGAYVKRLLVNETLFGDAEHHLERYANL
ncbi:acyl-CoA dehydrogenase family protein [Kordiimonas aquimaris]|uniref:acyl-CoA dehydrogenase family protein n=1 Tax=Kordiimonas aquimaris TaxID=707591 RepID=UPI0021CE039A|nr:acyl-CoA dehydrogenase family protein [Kordiimonas aquimaris]